MSNYLPFSAGIDRHNFFNRLIAICHEKYSNSIHVTLLYLNYLSDTFYKKFCFSVILLKMDFQIYTLSRRIVSIASNLWRSWRELQEMSSYGFSSSGNAGEKNVQLPTKNTLKETMFNNLLIHFKKLVLQIFDHPSYMFFTPINKDCNMILTH